MSENLVKIPVIAVVGPTASGKTKLAIAIAKRYNGEIISADSMQIYKGFPIASAAPDNEEKQSAVHHLVEFLEPSEKFSVADYVSLAGKTIAEVYSKGKLPIIAGGTGLYINSLIDGIKFSDQKTDLSLRQSIEEEFDSLGAEKMLKKLYEIDKEAAEKLSVGDRRRIVRALEIYRSTGMTITEQNRLSKQVDSPYEPLMIGITYQDREKLYERINQRVDIMLKKGLLEEAKNAGNKGITAAQAIGHKEFIPYFNGEVSLEEATDTLKRETRRYAKRQLTWFRRDPRINWIYADKEDPLKRAFEIIEERMK